MSIPKTTPPPAKRPTVKQEQAALTRRRIEQAISDLLHHTGAIEQITFNAVAKQAGVTEMTVYRHFPSRDALLTAIWEQTNRALGPTVRMPQTYAALLAQHRELFTGFDKLAPFITAILATPQGRELRAALNAPRRKAFLAIAAEAAPHPPGNPPKLARQAAAVIQLLHSAHAWSSLREQWGMSGAEAAQATRWAIETLMNALATPTSSQKQRSRK